MRQLFFEESVQALKIKWCAPYLVPLKEVTSEQTFTTPEMSPATIPNFSLNVQFDLRKLLFSDRWLTKDIPTIASTLKRSTGVRNDKCLDAAFRIKYANMPLEDDARAVSMDWPKDLNRAISHVNPKALKGRLLHIGSDAFYEPQSVHKFARSVILLDVSRQLLSDAVQASPLSKSIHSRVENLTGIPRNSIDFYVALRVFNSAGLNIPKAIDQAARVLKPGGSILLSLSNGYRAIDNTILPGQIIGDPPTLSLSKPFDDAVFILHRLFDVGFHELFFVVADTEIYLGGTYLPDSNNNNYGPILHADDLNSIPLCFYSPLMPTAWLGNYSKHPIKIAGTFWPTVEHFFQSEKFADSYYKDAILKCRTAADAKSFAWQNSSAVKDSWNDVRTDVMICGLKAKFSQHILLKKALQQTGTRELIEISSHDDFWGRSIKGSGQNMMGKLLMELRDKYKYQ